MAFNFDAQRDSSSEEDGGIDLSAWKSGAGAKPRPLPAPVAQMVQRDADVDESDEVSMDISNAAGPSALASFKNSGLRQSISTSTSRTRSPALPSFQAINEPVPDEDEDDEDDEDNEGRLSLASFLNPEIEGDEDEEEEPLLNGRKPLYVGISRSEVDRDDYERVTKRKTTVKRVLREWQDEDGGMMYTVMFGDFDVAQVR